MRRMIPHIWVTGPRDSIDTLWLDSEFATLDAVAHMVLNLGLYPVTPRRNNEGRKWQTEAERVLMLECDAVLAPAGWEYSVSAKLDVSDARSNGLAVLHSITELNEAWNQVQRARGVKP